MSTTHTLYVMRHGAAQSKAATDQERALTDAGRQEVATACEQLSCGELDFFVVSPFVRAQQTAEIVARDCEVGLPPSVNELITPGGRVKTVDEWLGSFEWRSGLLVSHQPLVGLLVEFYCGGDCRQFPTAGIAAIEGEIFGRGLCKLKWVST